MQEQEAFNPDEWEEVTDPREIKQVVGQGGLTKLVGGKDGGNAGEAKAQQKSANLDSLVEQINRVQDLYDKNYRGRPVSRLFGFTEYLPGPSHSQFNTAAAGLAEQGLAAFRVPGSGAQSDAELRQFVDANRPYANDYDEAVEEKLRQLRSRVDATRKAQGLPPVVWPATGEDRDNAIAVSGGGSAQGSGGGPAAPTPSGPAPDEQLVFNDEARPVTGYRFTPEQEQQIAQAVRDGDEGQTLALLQRFSNFAPTEQTRESVRNAIKSAREGGKVSFSYGAVDSAAQTISDREKYGDYLPQMLNERKDAGLDATVRSVAQGVPFVGGWMDEAEAWLQSQINGTPYDDEWRKQQAMDEADSRLHPGKQFAGQVAGALAVPLAAGRAAPGIAQRVTSGSGLARTGKLLATDAAVGASYGAGASRSGDRVEGAGQGAVLGALFGQGGRAAASGVGRALSPVSDPSVQRLVSEGVTLTPGQVAGAGGGVLGRIAKGVEDRAAGFPLVGDVVNSARRRGIEQWNIARVNSALKPLGVKVPNDIPAGHEAIAFAEKSVSDAIEESLSGITAHADAAFNVGAVKIARMADKLPKVQREALDNIMESELKPFLNSQTMNGQQLQAVKQTLDGHITSFSKGSPSDRLLLPVLEKMRDEFLELAARSSPDAARKFRTANEAFARLTRVQAAAKQSVADGVFTPGQFSTAVRQGDRSARKRMTAKGEALMQQDASDAQKVLPSSVPDSGTPGRVALGFGAAASPAAGGAFALGPGALAAAAPLLAYAPGVSNALQNVLLKRPDGVIKAGQIVQRNALLGGLLATPFGMAAIRGE